jgi:Zn finger protein HypA/HybF involved in hydrogenase expression
METRSLDPKDTGQDADWVGNNAAFTCPRCSKVFLVSGLLHRGGRACPSCGASKGHVVGGRDSGGTARLEWNDQPLGSN